MREKMGRERLKMEERELKRLEKERRRKEEKTAKESKLRETLGLSNIMSYSDIDFKKPGARAQADFIDTATASLF